MDKENKKGIASELFQTLKDKVNGEQKVDLLSIAKKLSEKRTEIKKKK